MQHKIVRTSFAVVSEDWVKFKNIIGQRGQKAQFVLEGLVKEFIEKHSEDKTKAN